MLPTTEKTLYINKDDLFIWIKYINNNDYVINLTDKFLKSTQTIAEFDGYKYNVVNEKLFNGVFIDAIRENRKILTDIREFIEFHKPFTLSTSDFFKMINERYNLWLKTKKSKIKRLWIKHRNIM